MRPQCDSSSFAPQDEVSRGFVETRPLNFLFVLAVGLIAGTISGIVGTGSSIMLMPVLVYQYGPKQAGPIMGGSPPVGEPSGPLPGGGPDAAAAPRAHTRAPSSA